jgi:hypothetical protein
VDDRIRPLAVRLPDRPDTDDGDPLKHGDDGDHIRRVLRDETPIKHWLANDHNLSALAAALAAA